MLQKTSKPDKAGFKLALKLSFKGSEQAALVKKSIQPELNAGHAKRSRTSISIKNKTLSISINAKDAVAMRASINGCLNSVILAKNISEV